MKAKEKFGRDNAKRLGLAAFYGCIVVPIIVVAFVKSNSHQSTILSLQLSIRTYGPFSTMEEEGGSKQIGGNLTSLPLQLRLVQERNESITGMDGEPKNLPIFLNEKTCVNNSNADNEKKNENKLIVEIEMKEEQNGNKTVIDNKVAEMSVVSSGKPEKNSTDTFKSNNDESSIINEKIELPTDMKEKHENNSVLVAENLKLPQNLKEKQDENKIVIDNKQDEVPLVTTEQPEQYHTIEGNNILQESKLACDFSEPRSDTCSMQGDIRILPKSSTIILSSSSKNSTAKIRPYARKWESPVMQQINEIMITPLPDPKLASVCSTNNSVTAVIFSTGGFLGNFFHDFTDVLVPLFVTSRHFQGEVQFLVTDFNSKWIKKYEPILKKLSKYEIIDMDSDTKTHCYQKAHLGLLSHKVLGIDPSKTPNGYSMIDFKQFLRSCYKLNIGSTKVISKSSRKKPRLLMILRKGSRSLVNGREVVAMARSIGYRVITAGPDDTRDTGKFARVVNSCDVMMGVHGAGLANMMFLPTNASLIQIVPWGGLKWACWHDFGEPAPNMGLNYVEYEIKEEESSLIEEYPKDHAVFKDPMSIHRQGWNQLWSIFLNKQKVKLDVERFRGVLLEIYQTLKK